MARVCRHRYRDPLERIWLSCAERVGLKVERSDQVYAHTAGDRALLIGTQETLDPDDCLAQMIFHELCHAMSQGPQSLDRPDWGIDNTNPKHIVHEHACLRLQAVLAGRHGLRRFLAPTTDFRSFYDRLSDDPLSPRDEPSCRQARLGLEHSQAPPFHPHVEEALVATAAVVRAVRPFAEGRDEGELKSLFLEGSGGA